MNKVSPIFEDECEGSVDSLHRKMDFKTKNTPIYQ
jgi:hypothetical protein